MYLPLVQQQGPISRKMELDDPPFFFGKDYGLRQFNCLLLFPRYIAVASGNQEIQFGNEKGEEGREERSGEKHKTWAAKPLSDTAPWTP